MSLSGHRQSNVSGAGPPVNVHRLWRLTEISEGRCILFRQVRIVHEAYAQTPAVTETQNPVGV